MAACTSPSALFPLRRSCKTFNALTGSQARQQGRCHVLHALNCAVLHSGTTGSGARSEGARHDSSGHHSAVVAAPPVAEVSRARSGKEYRVRSSPGSAISDLPLTVLPPASAGFDCTCCPAQRGWGHNLLMSCRHAPHTAVQRLQMLPPCSGSSLFTFMRLAASTAVFFYRREKSWSSAAACMQLDAIC